MRLYAITAPPLRLRSEALFPPHDPNQGRNQSARGQDRLQAAQADGLRRVKRCVIQHRGRGQQLAQRDQVLPGVEHTGLDARDAHVAHLGHCGQPERRARRAADGERGGRQIEAPACGRRARALPLHDGQPECEGGQGREAQERAGVVGIDQAGQRQARGRAPAPARVAQRLDQQPRGPRQPAQRQELRQVALGESSRQRSGA